MITPPPRGRRHTGFTLFELLLVLAILAIILGMAIPALRRLARRSEVQDAARQLRATLLQTRLGAIRYFQSLSLQGSITKTKEGAEHFRFDIQLKEQP